MSRTKSLAVIKDGSPDLEARIITAIGAAGPRNVAQISRMTGAHQETIRYKIKKRFGRLGFKFHAVVDYDKLGLSLHWGTLDFSNVYGSIASQALRALNQVGYLTYYARLVPQGNYVALFALPQGTAGQYRDFLSGLVSKGILTRFALEEVLVTRHKVMDPRFFNFRSGRWEIEWNKVTEQPPIPIPSERRQRPADFDYYDLLVIKELQKDSLQHLTGIAKKLKVHQKTLEYHYRTHVQKWKLIPSYRIRWAQDITKRPVHSTVMTRMRFTDLSRPEFAKIQAAISKVPFLWQEDLLQGGTYTAMMYVPLVDLINVSSYVTKAAPGLASRVEVAFINASDASSFTIPHHMYQDGAWKFNARQVEAALRKEAVVPLQK